MFLGHLHDFQQDAPVTFVPLNVGGVAFFIAFGAQSLEESQLVHYCTMSRAKGTVSAGGVRHSPAVSSEKWERSPAT